MCFFFLPVCLESFAGTRVGHGRLRDGHVEHARTSRHRLVPLGILRKGATGTWVGRFLNPLLLLGYSYSLFLPLFHPLMRKKINKRICKYIVAISLAFDKSDWFCPTGSGIVRSWCVCVCTVITCRASCFGRFQKKDRWIATVWGVPPLDSYHSRESAALASLSLGALRKRDLTDDNIRRATITYPYPHPASPPPPTSSCLASCHVFTRALFCMI